jgi:uncharacterized integral membrane protein
MIILYEGGVDMAYLVLMLVVSLTVALFAVQNAVTVDVSFIAWKFSTSLVMVILLSVLAGIIIALFWMLKMKTQNYLNIKKLNEQIAALQKDAEKLTEENRMLKHSQKIRTEAIDKQALPLQQKEIKV